MTAGFDFTFGKPNLPRLRVGPKDRGGAAANQFSHKETKPIPLYWGDGSEGDGGSPAAINPDNPPVRSDWVTAFPLPPKKLNLPAIISRPLRQRNCKLNRPR